MSAFPGVRIELPTGLMELSVDASTYHNQIFGFHAGLSHFRYSSLMFVIEHNSKESRHW